MLWFEVWFSEALIALWCREGSHTLDALERSADFARSILVLEAGGRLIMGGEGAEPSSGQTHTTQSKIRSYGVIERCIT